MNEDKLVETALAILRMRYPDKTEITLRPDPKRDERIERAVRRRQQWDRVPFDPHTATDAEWLAIRNIGPKMLERVRRIYPYPEEES